MSKLIQICVGLLFITSLSYFGWWTWSEIKFFEEVYYFGFKGCLLIPFFVFRYYHPELKWYLDLSIIQVSIGIIWDIYAAKNWEAANQQWVIISLFVITLALISAIFLEKFLKRIFGMIFKQKG